MPENQTSLEQAMTRIMGAPAGGTPQVADIVQMAPKAPYSQELATTPTTQSRISNTSFDPFAAQAAELAVLQAQNAAPGGGGATGTTPVGLTYEQYVAREQARNPGADLSGILGLGYRQYQANVAPLPATPYTKDQYVANQIQYGVPKEAMTGQIQDIGYNSYLAGYQRRGGTIPPEIAAARTASATAAAKPAPSKPINPGSRAPWQQSAQYWKDLASYKNAGGV